MTILSPSDPSHCDQLISTNGKKAERVYRDDISKAIVDRLTKMARLGRNERCGFLTAAGAIYPIANGHEEPTHNFFMEKADVKQAVEEIYEISNDRISAIWHTHPNNIPWPSPRDIHGWPNLALGWRYLIVTHSEVLEWKLV